MPRRSNRNYSCSHHSHHQHHYHHHQPGQHPQQQHRVHHHQHRHNNQPPHPPHARLYSFRDSRTHRAFLDALRARAGAESESGELEEGEIMSSEEDEDDENGPVDDDGASDDGRASDDSQGYTEDELYDDEAQDHHVLRTIPPSQAPRAHASSRYPSAARHPSMTFLHTPVLETILDTTPSHHPPRCQPNLPCPPPPQNPLPQTTACLSCEHLTLMQDRLLDEMRSWLKDGTALLQLWSRDGRFLDSEASADSEEGSRSSGDDGYGGVGRQHEWHYHIPRHQKGHGPLERSPPEYPARFTAGYDESLVDEGIDMMDWEAAAPGQPSNLAPAYTFSVPDVFSQIDLGCGLAGGTGDGSLKMVQGGCYMTPPQTPETMMM